MFIARAFVSGLTLLFASSLAVAQDGPMLRYVFDKSGTQNDVGRIPSVHGALSPAATAVSESPNTFSCGSLDLTADDANHNYAASTSDVQKIDALGAMTVCFWINLQGNPSEDDCIVSDAPAGIPAAGQGGWEVRVSGDETAPTASHFHLSFQVLQANDGWTSIQSQLSPELNASDRWVFVAATYSAALEQRYYTGTETAAVSQIGVNAQYSYPLAENDAEFRVGSASSEPLVDRTPPAWIDDVRVYDRALSAAELDEVRLQNLEYRDLFAVPGVVALGGVPGSACSVYAQSLSADGSTVVGQAAGSTGQWAYRWKNGIRSLLPDLPGGNQSGIALRTSADGSIVVGSGQPETGESEAMMWDGGGNHTGLGDFPGGELWSAAYGVSDDGSVVVGVGVDRAGYYADAFRYAGGTLSKLGYLDGGAQSIAYDVSSDGRVIVGVGESSAGTQAFRWEQGIFTPLGDLAGGAFESRANRISGNRLVVVGAGQSASGKEAACWVRQRVFGLGDLPGGLFQSEAHAVSGWGSVVVGRGRAAGTSSSGTDEAFIWDRIHGMRSLKSMLETDYGLDLTGWRMITALGISDDGGTITGSGVNPAGLQDAFLVRLPFTNALMDFDFDEDVDARDLEVFAACATGPGVAYIPGDLPAGCAVAADSLGLIPPDLDWDGDVDQIDFGLLQPCLGQPGDSPPVGCRG